jgi:methyl-accepting chemotaxis protein
MNSILVFAIMVVLIIIVVLIVCILFYRRSIVSGITLIITNMSCLTAFLSYIIASKGLSHLYWAVPVVLLFAAFNFWALTRFFSNPVKMLTKNIVDKLALGKIDFHFEEDLLNKKNEYGEIAKALEQMKENIFSIVDEVNDITEKIKISADQQSQTAVYISSGASEQAASTEEISSTIEELTAANHQNAENAKSTSLLSQSVFTAMEELSNSSKKNLESITNIINKIKIVNDISFQTNILSLNASVEAARAGEAGSGFLVIAHEIRSLADLSKNAANEIHKLSDNTMKETRDTVKNIDIYLEAVKQTTELIEQISSATEEQTIGTDQINVAIQQLNQIAQQNSATSEELAASYEELNDQARNLSKKMRYFKMN